MDLEYVWGAECGDCGTRILRTQVRVGTTLDECLGTHKEMLCPANAGSRARPWPSARTPATA